MKTTITLLTLIVSLYSDSHAMLKMKSAHTPVATQAASFRNALTDVTLTKLDHPETTAVAYAAINLAYIPDHTDGKYVSSYHGKHVTAIVFSSLAAVFLFIAYLFVKAAKDSTNAGSTFLGIGACTAGFLGFGIPGTILMFRYPHSQPKMKE